MMMEETKKGVHATDHSKTVCSDKYGSVGEIQTKMNSDVTPSARRVIFRSPHLGVVDHWRPPQMGCLVYLVSLFLCTSVYLYLSFHMFVCLIIIYCFQELWLRRSRS